MQTILVQKGAYGYLKNKKIFTALRTALYFAVCLGLYGMGIATTGSNKNLLTVVAVLGCLPACKSAVNCILFLTATGCSEALHQRTMPFDKRLVTFYDLYFTSYQKNYPMSHMAFRGNVLLGMTETPSQDCEAAQKHLETLLMQEGIRGVEVSICSEGDEYIDRLSRLADMEGDVRENEGVLRLLRAVSL